MRQSKFLRRLNRWSLWSKEKRQRFHNRYCKWLLHLVKKPFVEDIEGYHLRIQLQQGLEKWREET